MNDKNQSVGLITVHSSGGKCTAKIKCERGQEVVWVVLNLTGDKQKVELVNFKKTCPGAPKSPFARGKRPDPNPAPLDPHGVTVIRAEIADNAFCDYSYDINLNSRRATSSPVLEI